MVDRVKGTPKRAAARAAWISPSGYCIPSEPTGANAAGIVTLRPSIMPEISRSDRSRATRWCNRILAKSELFSRKVCSV
jgi:hypothetical protein